MDNLDYNKIYLKLNELRNKAEKNKYRELTRDYKSEEDRMNMVRSAMHYDGLCDGYTIAMAVVRNNGVLD